MNPTGPTIKKKPSPAKSALNTAASVARDAAKSGSLKAVKVKFNESGGLKKFAVKMKVGAKAMAKKAA